MPATLTRSRTGDVAVIALDREQSIRFLCRSLTTGTAFANFPAVLIDARHVGPLGPRTRAAVHMATRECLTRRQLLGVVEPGEHVRRAVAQARQTRRLLQHPAPVATTALHGMGDVLAVFVRGSDALLRRAGRARVRIPR
jgi:hypothetical protein